MINKFEKQIKALNALYKKYPEIATIQALGTILYCIVWGSITFTIGVITGALIW